LRVRLSLLAFERALRAAQRLWVRQIVHPKARPGLDRGRIAGARRQIDAPPYQFDWAA